jgi:ubiquinone/menaquinone biosynthesis C-methylase UbiE
VGEPTVGFSTLEELPLGELRPALKQAIAPFSSKFDAAVWSRDVRRRALKSAARIAKRLLGRKRRDTHAIQAEYAEAWSAPYERYDIHRVPKRAVPWMWGERRLLLDPNVAARVRAPMLAAVIRKLKPKRVLEVGFGNGINLLVLAPAFPEIEFSGVELTETGTAAAKSVQAGPLPQILADFSPLESKDPLAHQRINFIQGSAAELPFEAGQFDLVFTVLAVEQMERIRARALSEIARVASGHVAMIEPFRDANDSGLRRLYSWSRNYFRGGIDELASFGLEPQWATVDFPQEVFLGSPLVLSKVTRPGA